MLSDVAQLDIKRFYELIAGELPEEEVEAFSLWAGAHWQAASLEALIDEFNRLKVGKYRSDTDFAIEKRNELLDAASQHLASQGGGLAGGPAHQALRDLAANVDIGTYLKLLRVDYQLFRLPSGSVFVIDRH